MYTHGVRGPKPNLTARTRQGAPNPNYPPQIHHVPQQHSIPPRHHHHHHQNFQQYSINQQQQLDHSDSYPGPGGPIGISGPRPVFTNGKKSGNSGMNRAGSRSPSEQPLSANEECVKYVSDAWSRVQKEMEMAQRQGTGGGPVYYIEKQLGQFKDFQPFDLEKWKAGNHQL
ncbi:MAPK regulated corepressor interacting protein 2-like isoform X2 [Tubulanus polymorphus]|uniref:MAPK regulated corepressor interacting protein 2-like isoform X2 n=1 Tax=Tubulanus polymorphus TaxID=672921 RepID=UPI003DA26B08